MRAIEQRVRTISPSARISAHRDRVAPLLSSMRALQWLAFGLVLLLSAASAAAVVLNTEGKVLILHHLLRPKTGWGLPGGFLDAGEQPHEAIARELREETGIEIGNVRMLYVKTLGRHVELLFAATARATGEVRTLEIDHLGWYAFADIPTDLPAHDKRTIERVLKGEI